MLRSSTPRLSWSRASHQGLAYFPQVWIPPLVTLRDGCAWSPGVWQTRSGRAALRAPSRTWEIRNHRMSRLGDLVYNLQVSTDQRLFTPVTADVQQVFSRRGRALEERPGARR